MMKRALLGILLIHAVIIGVSADSVADEVSFRCTVRDEYRLTDDGQLVKPDKYYYTKASFSVERSTGRVIGGAFDNRGDHMVKTIDDGSFRVYSFSEKRGVAESLAIRTWQKGEKSRRGQVLQSSIFSAR